MLALGVKDTLVSRAVLSCCWWHTQQKFNASFHHCYAVSLWALVKMKLRGLLSESLSQSQMNVFRNYLYCSVLLGFCVHQVFSTLLHFTVIVLFLGLPCMLLWFSLVVFCFVCLFAYFFISISCSSLCHLCLCIRTYVRTCMYVLVYYGCMYIPMYVRMYLHTYVYVRMYVQYVHMLMFVAYSFR